MENLQFDYNSSEDTRHFLRNELSSGKLYVALEYVDSPLSKEDMRCFDTSYDAQEYCYEHTTDLDTMQFYPTVHLLKAVETFIQKKDSEQLALWIDRFKETDTPALSYTLEDKIKFTQLLDKCMRKADWYFDHSNDHDVRQRGLTDTRVIVEGLKALTYSYKDNLEANRMWQQYVPKNSIQTPDFLTSKQNMMDEKTLSINEGQYKRIGLQEAFTPEVQEQMKQGVPLIQQSLHKEYDGDKVDATLYLKKMPTGDLYFINKMDLNLQKPDKPEPLKHTFWVNHKQEEYTGDGPKPKPEVKFTFKKAYNFLAGRPVYHPVTEAWEKMNVKEKLSNDNYATLRYDKNYGFNLESTLKNYSIKDMQDNDDRLKLVNSIERGNLQKATFVDKDGHQEKLYVSPSITTGSLNVYDSDKKPVPLEVQMEKQWISGELGNRLKILYQQKHSKEELPKQQMDTPDKQQKQKATTKQTTAQDVNQERPKRKQKIK